LIRMSTPPYSRLIYSTTATTSSSPRQTKRQKQNLGSPQACLRR